MKLVYGVEHRVERAIGSALANGTQKHVHSERCSKLIHNIMTPGEETIMECKQSYIHNISPTRVIATNRRIIVVRPSFWGLYTGHDLIMPTEYNIIPYKHLISVLMSRGRFLSTIHMRILGFTDTSSSVSDEGEIYGIRTEQAVKLAKFLEEIIEYSEEETGVEGRASELIKKTGNGHLNTEGIGLDKARELLQNGAKFIWIGVEPIGYVSTILGVGKEQVVKADISHITEASPEELEKFRNCIFVGYEGTMAARVSSYLKRNYKIKSYVLEGGITEVAQEYFTKTV